MFFDTLEDTVTKILFQNSIQSVHEEFSSSDLLKRYVGGSMKFQLKSV